MSVLRGICPGLTTAQDSHPYMYMAIMYNSDYIYIIMCICILNNMYMYTLYNHHVYVIIMCICILYQSTLGH